MPGQWTSIETNFPSFTGDEPVKDQIRQMHNYLYILTEQLKYNLANLNADNFNASALTQLTENTSSEAAAMIAEDLEKINGLYGQLSARVAALNATLTALSGTVTGQGEVLLDHDRRIGVLEQDAVDLQQAVAQLEDKTQSQQENLEELGALVTALEEESDEQGQRLAKTETAQKALAEVVAAQEDGVTVGGEGKVVRLVGSIYINGVLFEQDQNAEQEEGA